MVTQTAPQDIPPENAEVVDRDEGERRSTGWTGWLISGTFHVLLLFIMYGIYWVVKQPEVESAPVRICSPPAAPPPVVKKDSDIRQKDPIDLPDITENPSPVTSLVIPVEDNQTDDQTDTEQAKGEVAAVTDISDGGAGFAMIIGGGSNAAGQHGLHSTGGRKHAVGKGGGSRPSELAVESSLRWFKRHQSPNGMWDAVNYYKNCTEAGGKCEPGTVNHGSVDGTNAAMTGYALLCYLTAGYDHVTPNRYKSVVKHGLEYLISVQKADGLLGERNYENAVASMALSEAYAMTQDPSLKDPAQRAVNQILAHQNQAAGAAQAPDSATSGYGAGLGWDYVGPSTRNDSSVSGWNVMALKSALAAGLNVGNGLAGAKTWLTTVWKKQNPDWQKLDSYKGESRFPYTWDSATGNTEIAAAPADGQPSANDHDLSCVGGVCAVFLGHHAGDPMLESLSNYVFKHQMPSAYPCNIYYLYYNTMTMFQVGGERWKAWNGRVRDMLVNAVHKEPGCMEGSFDWNGTSFPGNETGRVLSTAYCTLSLEVYYHFDHENLKP